MDNARTFKVQIKKNVLDLHYTKWLQVQSISIMVGFMYLIGVGIALVTKQLQLENWVHIMLLAMLSIAFLSICTMTFYRAQYHMKNILEEMRRLRSVAYL